METCETTKKETLRNEVREGLNNVIRKFLKEHNATDLEAVNVWHDVKFADVFQYAHICERSFEHNLEMIKGTKRQTTFTSDLSIAEWCFPAEGFSALTGTINNVVRNWADDLTFMREFSLALAWKGEEHMARKNRNWARLWYDFYLVVYDAMTKYYKGDKEKSYDYWSYLD